MVLMTLLRCCGSIEYGGPGSHRGSMSGVEGRPSAGVMQGGVCSGGSVLGDFG